MKQDDAEGGGSSPRQEADGDSGDHADARPSAGRRVRQVTDGLRQLFGSRARGQKEAAAPGPLPQERSSHADVPIEELHRNALRENSRLVAEAEIELGRLRDRAPRDIDVAIRRFRKHQRDDPFPGVTPGLLSCSEFCAYIVETGMMCPFQPRLEDVQLASLDLPLVGLAVWFDEHGEHREEIKPDKPFTLRKNSIAFVSLEPYLQLPDYIAMRFNLRVRHVYKGLLLGTGPMIDPGYRGYLAIPLHNLTNNDYEFRGGDQLIAVEFTKLDPASASGDMTERRAPPTGGRRPPHFTKPFPEPRLPRPSSHDEHPIDVNLSKEKVKEVASSLPALGSKIDKQVEVIQTTAESLRVDITRRFSAQNEKIENWTRALTVGGGVALIALLFTVGGIMWQATAEMRAITARERETFEKMDVQRRYLADSLTTFRTRLRTAEQILCDQAAADSLLAKRASVRSVCPR